MSPTGSPAVLPAIPLDLDPPSPCLYEPLLGPAPMPAPDLHFLLDSRPPAPCPASRLSHCLPLLPGPAGWQLCRSPDGPSAPPGPVAQRSLAHPASPAWLPGLWGCSWGLSPSARPAPAGPGRGGLEAAGRFPAARLEEELEARAASTWDPRAAQSQWGGVPPWAGATAGCPLRTGPWGPGQCPPGRALPPGLVEAAGAGRLGSLTEALLAVVMGVESGAKVPT